jgi:hypothetical protein
VALSAQDLANLQTDPQLHTCVPSPSHSRLSSFHLNTKNRPNRPPKGDVDSPWSHDLYETELSNNSLSARLTAHPTAPKANFTTIAQKALRAATSPSFSSEQLSIKGASTGSQGNVVEVTGLVPGTTAEDVVAIFKRCGVVSNAKTVPGGDEVRIRVTFKSPSSASAAVQKFNNQPADGKTLSVRIVGSTSAGTTLGGRLGGSDGLGLVREEGSVDVLMDTDGDKGSCVFIHFFSFVVFFGLILRLQKNAVRFPASCRPPCTRPPRSTGCKHSRLHQRTYRP